LGQIDNYKARLVAQGFSQVPGLDFNETYSPTIRFTTIRLILALACKYNLEVRQIDIKGAYLNGILEDDVYMRQPEGFVEPGKENLVCKLYKGIYGLKQSGRVWHHTLKSELGKLGFTPGNADTTVYFRFGDDGNIELSGWYMDDGLLAANSTESMERMISDIRGSFDIQDLGEPDRLVGIRISQNRELGTIHISQPLFINTIAKRFEITSGRSVTSPMDQNSDLRVATNADDTIDVPYASLIGSINYCAVSTRPDISYATNKCAQFTSKPTLEHWEAAKRIVHYLMHTKEHGITYIHDGQASKDTLIISLDSQTLTLQEMSMIGSQPPGGFLPSTAHQSLGRRRNRASSPDLRWNRNWWQGL
jgi:Reverse transcriptase (RNA-dependent DNA polymerase)